MIRPEGSRRGPGAGRIGRGSGFVSAGGLTFGEGAPAEGLFFGAGSGLLILGGRAGIGAGLGSTVGGIVLFGGTTGF
jgi:hypothetical protein